MSQEPLSSLRSAAAAGTLHTEKVFQLPRQYVLCIKIYMLFFLYFEFHGRYDIVYRKSVEMDCVWEVFFFRIFKGRRRCASEKWRKFMTIINEMWQPSSEAMGERESVWRFLVSSSARSELSLFFGCFVSRNRVRSEWSAASISTLWGGARVRIEWGRSSWRVPIYLFLSNNS